MKFKISKKAAKFLSKQNEAVRLRILNAIYRLPDTGDIKTMQSDRRFFRLRVGTVRVIFRVDDDCVFIETIGNRGDVYGKM